MDLKALNKEKTRGCTEIAQKKVRTVFKVKNQHTTLSRGCR